jgi:hypothetical protein
MAGFNKGASFRYAGPTPSRKKLIRVEKPFQKVFIKMVDEKS